MFKHNINSSRIASLLTLAILPILAACGGEDGSGGGKSSRNSSGGSGSGVGGALFCFAVVLVSGDDECVSSVTSSSTGGSGGTSGGTSGGSSGSGISTGTNDSIVYMDNYDFEPNNDWLNANILAIMRTTSRDGFVVDGMVHDTADPVDTFSFSRSFSRNFRIRLCAPAPYACGQSGEIDTITAYIDVLDSNGNVVASSQAASRNLVETPIQAGLTYYVRVVAGDTMATTVAYNLYGHEFE